MDKFITAVWSIMGSTLNRLVSVPNGAQWKCKRQGPGRANKWSVSGVRETLALKSHVCHCFGHSCLATVTAISHRRDMSPNPIRSAHYGEMGTKGSDGTRKDKVRDGWWEDKERARWREHPTRRRWEEKKKWQQEEREIKMIWKWEAWLTGLCLQHTHIYL